MTNYETDENDLECFDDFIDYYGFNQEDVKELDFNENFYNIKDDESENFENDKKE